MRRTISRMIRVGTTERGEEVANVLGFGQGWPARCHSLWCILSISPTEVTLL